MHWPWFGKDAPDNVVRVCQPLFLQSFAEVGGLTARTAIAGLKPVQQPAPGSNRNVPSPPAPPSQYAPAYVEFIYASSGAGLLPALCDRAGSNSATFNES